MPTPPADETCWSRWLPQASSADLLEERKRVLGLLDTGLKEPQNRWFADLMLTAIKLELTRRRLAKPRPRPRDA
jgi:hypothetical protein